MSKIRPDYILHIKDDKTFSDFNGLWPHGYNIGATVNNKNCVDSLLNVDMKLFNNELEKFKTDGQFVYGNEVFDKLAVKLIYLNEKYAAYFGKMNDYEYYDSVYNKNNFEFLSVEEYIIKSLLE